MSGLSLRTVQRLEAGHRVSYASLRALATAFGIDVDVLERELYAVSNSTDDFVEIPRWIRLMDGRRWFGGPGLSRRDVLLIEAFCVVCSVITFVASFLVTENARAFLARMSVIPLVGCYLTVWSIRVMDRYGLWPGSVNAPPPKPRTWRTITAEYAYMIGVGALGIAVTLWLIA
jgi:hypothetical protein